MTEPIPNCNFCGETCGLGKDKDDYETSGGLTDTKVCGNYYSTAGNGYGALDDCTTYSFSICEFCLDWLFAQFKTPPKIGHYMWETNDLPEDWRPAQQRIEEDSWRKDRDDYCKKEIERRAKLRNIKG